MPLTILKAEVLWPCMPEENPFNQQVHARMNVLCDITVSLSNSRNQHMLSLSLF